MKVDDLVIVFRSEDKTNFSAKLAFRWKGPFRIREVLHGGASYRLAELDGTDMDITFPPKNLKHVPLFPVDKEPDELL